MLAFGDWEGLRNMLDHIILCVYKYMYRVHVYICMCVYTRTCMYVARAIKNIGGFLIWRFGSGSPNRQIKCIAIISEFTVYVQQFIDS